MEGWHNLGAWGNQGVPETKGWTEVNGGASRRLLKKPPPGYPDKTLVDVSVNGKIATRNKNQYLANHFFINGGIHSIFKVLDDPSMKETDLELGFRIRDSGRVGTLFLSHIYYS